MKQNAIFTMICGIIVLLATSCGPGTRKVRKEADVVATSTMVADMVQTIAGPDLEVLGLMAAGVDPHSYELPAGAYSDLRNAALLVYNGVHLEGKLTDTFEARSDSALALSDSLPKGRILAGEQVGEDYGDPHIWGDAGLWALTIPSVVEALVALKPEKKADFETRGAAYQKEIEALDAWIKERVEEVPADKRILITSHDAFNYFGKAYGFQVVAPQGISTVDEPSMTAITQTVDFIKENGIKAIFPESSVPTAIVDRIAKDAGVIQGRTLFSDSTGELGKTDTRNGETYDLGTYIGMMKHNVNAIVDALK